MQIISVKADNGEHSHFRLIDVITGRTLWEENNVCEYMSNCVNLQHGDCSTCDYSQR